MSADEKDVFFESIRETIYEWKALQISISQGMGGAESSQKRDWMITVVYDYFKQYSDVSKEEIGEYIAEIVDNEFDTCVEDGSLEYLAYMLCKYRDMFADGKHEELRTIVDEKIKQRTKSECIPQINEVSRKMETVALNDTKDVSMESEENDGWTVVNKKGKGKKMS